MKALTVWQPWATLIIEGFKPFEFRRWPTPRGLVGQRIVVHAGSRKMKAAELLALIDEVTFGELHAGFNKPDEVLALLRRAVDNPNILPLAAGLGTAVLGQARRPIEIFAGKVTDSSRIDEHVWGWPMGDIKRFEPPVPARGFQGFWPWNGEAP